MDLVILALVRDGGRMGLEIGWERGLAGEGAWMLDKDVVYEKGRPWRRMR